MSNITPAIDTARPTDVIVMGRVTVDLYANQLGTPLSQVQSFNKYLGGCAGNIAVGTARLGLQSSLFSCVGSDDLGQFLLQTLKQEKVDISLVKTSDAHLTGIGLLGITKPDNFSLLFYRENCADMQIRAENITPENVQQSKALVITGNCLSQQGIRAATLHAAEIANQQQTFTVLDIDYRPMLWGLTKAGDGQARYASDPEVTRQYQRVLPLVNLIVGSQEEVLIAGGNDNLSQAVDTIRNFTAAPIVIKHGAEGCSVYFDDLSAPLTSPAYPWDALNMLGAGDAFISGLLSGLLREQTWEHSLQLANACAAIVVRGHGRAPAMPHADDLLQFIEQTSSID